MTQREKEIWTHLLLLLLLLPRYMIFCVVEVAWLNSLQARERGGSFVQLLPSNICTSSKSPDVGSEGRGGSTCTCAFNPRNHSSLLRLVLTSGDNLPCLARTEAQPCSQGT